MSSLNFFIKPFFSLLIAGALIAGMRTPLSSTRETQPGPVAVHEALPLNFDGKIVLFPPKDDEAGAAQAAGEETPF